MGKGIWGLSVALERSPGEAVCPGTLLLLFPLVGVSPFPCSPLLPPPVPRPLPQGNLTVKSMFTISCGLCAHRPVSASIVE